MEGGLLPMIKCSNCGMSVEISSMGDHVCVKPMPGKYLFFLPNRSRLQLCCPPLECNVLTSPLQRLLRPLNPLRRPRPNQTMCYPPELPAMPGPPSLEGPALRLALTLQWPVCLFGYHASLRHPYIRVMRLMQLTPAFQIVPS